MLSVVMSDFPAKRSFGYAKLERKEWVNLLPGIQWKSTRDWA